MLLHKYHHTDDRQIAQVLNCRESAARWLLCSAYETLRRRLATSDRRLTGFSSESTRFQNELDPLQQIG
jgi:DNA-directed RNA polymerase specialized sigma24 family protein